MATKTKKAEPVELDEFELADLEDKKSHQTQVRAQARELGVDVKLALRADALDIPLEDLVGLELYRGQPVFRTPPPLSDKRTGLVDLRVFTRDMILAWLNLQGTIEIKIERDSNDDRIDPMGEKPFYRDFFWHGVRWPVEKGERVAVPWPIAAVWSEVGSLRKRRAQFQNYQDGLPLGSPIEGLG